MTGLTICRGGSASGTHRDVVVHQIVPNRQMRHDDDAVAACLTGGEHELVHQLRRHRRVHVLRGLVEHQGLRSGDQRTGGAQSGVQPVPRPGPRG